METWMICAAIAAVVLVAAIGVYIYNQKEGLDFVDPSTGFTADTSTCNLFGGACIESPIIEDN